MPRDADRPREEPLQDVRRRRLMLHGLASTSGLGVRVGRHAGGRWSAAIAGAAFVRSRGAAAEAPPAAALSRFSIAPPGDAMPPGWRHEVLRNVAPNRFRLDGTQTTTTLRVDVDGSASSLVSTVPPSLRAARTLRWRWRAGSLPAGGRLGVRDGDDFAARVYVMFDYPIDRLGVGDRLGLRVARALHGPSVPAAAICYVWHPRAGDDEVVDSPYTSRVRMIVAQTGSPGDWHAEQRDLDRDFRLAFGAEHGPGRAPLAAIALAADGDQTGARMTTWFGDVELS